MDVNVTRLSVTRRIAMRHQARVGGSENRGHFGAFGAGWSAALQNEPFSLIRRL